MAPVPSKEVTDVTRRHYLDCPDNIPSVEHMSDIFNYASSDQVYQYLQLVDSLMSEFKKTSEMPSSRQFPCSRDIEDVSGLIQTFLATKSPVQRATLEKHRSDRPRLPILPLLLNIGSKPYSTASVVKKAVVARIADDVVMADIGEDSVGHTVPGDNVASEDGNSDGENVEDHQDGGEHDDEDNDEDEDNDDEFAGYLEEDAFPSLFDVMKSKTGQYHGFVKNMDHWTMLKEEYLQLCNQNPEIRSNVPDFEDEPLPKILERIKKLFNAVKDKSGTIEDKTPPKKRKDVTDDSPQEEGNGSDTENQPVTRSSFVLARLDDIPDIVLEIVCWEIYMGMVDAQKGTVHLSPWPKIRDIHYEVYSSLQQRYEAVVEALKISKSIFNSIMSNNYLAKFLAAPRGSCETKRTNLKTNNKRNIETKVGRDAQKRRLYRVDDTKGIVHTNGNVVGSCASI